MAPQEPPDCAWHHRSPSLPIACQVSYAHGSFELWPRAHSDIVLRTCGAHNFCVGIEGSHIYCYGSNTGCRWDLNDCDTDEDCNAYNSASPKFSDATLGSSCPDVSGWAADACRTSPPPPPPSPPLASGESSQAWHTNLPPALPPVDQTLNCEQGYCQQFGFDMWLPRTNVTEAGCFLWHGGTEPALGANLTFLGPACACPSPPPSAPDMSEWVTISGASCQEDPAINPGGFTFAWSVNQQFHAVGRLLDGSSYFRAEAPVPSLYLVYDSNPILCGGSESYGAGWFILDAPPSLTRTHNHLAQHARTCDSIHNRAFFPDASPPPPPPPPPGRVETYWYFDFVPVVDSDGTGGSAAGSASGASTDAAPDPEYDPSVGFLVIGSEGGSEYVPQPPSWYMGEVRRDAALDSAASVAAVYAYVRATYLSEFHPVVVLETAPYRAYVKSSAPAGGAGVLRSSDDLITLVWSDKRSDVFGSNAALYEPNATLPWNESAWEIGEDGEEGGEGSGEVMDPSAYRPPEGLVAARSIWCGVRALSGPQQITFVHSPRPPSPPTLPPPAPPLLPPRPPISFQAEANVQLAQGAAASLTVGCV